MGVVTTQARSSASEDTVALGRRMRLGVDLVGCCLLCVVVLLTLRSASNQGGDGLPVIAVVGVSTTALVLGRVAGLLFRPVAPALLASGGVVLAIAAWGELSSPAPLAGPFGYANSNAAFFDQAAIAGVMTAFAARSWFLRAVGVGSAIVAGLVVLVVGSAAAVVLLGLIACVVVAVRGARAARLGVMLAGAIFAAALATTLIVASTPTGSGRVDAAVTRAVTERRTTLWTDAFTTMSEHPATGVGPGRSWRYSEIGRQDLDAREAHHVFLQFGAETGVPGFATLVLLFAWGFVRLAVVERPDAVTVLGAVALATAGIHGSIDWVLNVVWVPAAAALLVGVAQAGRPRVTEGSEA